MKRNKIAANKYIHITNSQLKNLSSHRKNFPPANHPHKNYTEALLVTMSSH